MELHGCRYLLVGSSGLPPRCGVVGRVCGRLPVVGAEQEQRCHGGGADDVLLGDQVWHVGERNPAHRLAAGTAWVDSGLVFSTRLGKPLEPRNVNRSWYAARTRAGLGAVRLHDLRHSCASFLLAAGASPRTVMKTLGHSQIALTMNTYTHVLPEIERAAVDGAAEAIFGEGSAGASRAP